MHPTSVNGCNSMRDDAAKIQPVSDILPVYLEVQATCKALRFTRFALLQLFIVIIGGGCGPSPVNVGASAPTNGKKEAEITSKTIQKLNLNSAHMENHENPYANYYTSSQG